MSDFTASVKPLYDGAAIITTERAGSIINVDELAQHLLSRGTIFETTIREQGSEGQKKEWMKCVEDYDIIGAYAQTKLGHGSNARGVEYEARSDPERRESGLHSPTLTALKWWNGSLNRTANCAIVLAHDLTPNNSSMGEKNSEYIPHNPQPFVVQIARYIIKRINSIVNRRKTAGKDATDEIFKQHFETKASDQAADIVRKGFVNDKAIVRAFRWSAARLSFQNYQARLVKKTKWNAWSGPFVVSYFCNGVKNGKLSEPLRSALLDCYQLHALNNIDANARNLSSGNAITSSSIDAIPDTILTLMKRTRPHAVKLVDSCSMPDYRLESSLGRYDGKVYEDTFDRAPRHIPLSRVTSNPDWRSEEIAKGGDASEIKPILAKL